VHDDDHDADGRHDEQHAPGRPLDDVDHQPGLRRRTDDHDAAERHLR
jgi:hypothetical protein